MGGIKAYDYRRTMPKELCDRVVKYNRLIAQYMGYISFEDGWKIHKDVPRYSRTFMNEDFLCETDKGLAFHYDWNWLNRVVIEIFKRHKFVIYNIGNSFFVWHIDDFKVLHSVAAGKPEHFHYTATTKVIDDQIVGTWECVAVLLEHIFKEMDPMIPVIKEYKRRRHHIVEIPAGA